MTRPNWPLAYTMRLGIEAKKDAQQAARWYREATLKGNIEAQYRLARLISRGAKGLTADKTAAATLFAGRSRQRGMRLRRMSLVCACRMVTASMPTLEKAAALVPQSR